MKLGDVVQKLESFPEMTIYVADGSSGKADDEVILLPKGTRTSSAPPGFSYLLECDIAAEALMVWSEWRDGRLPNRDEAAEAVFYYGREDAYLPTEAMLREPQR